MNKVRKALVKAWGQQNNASQVRPGLLKRMFNAWFKQPTAARPPPSLRWTLAGSAR